MTSVSGQAGKLERIDQLAEHGLNTPRMVLVPAGTPFDAALVRRLREVAAGDALMTIRTYHPTDEVTYAKGPFAPEIPIEEAIALVEEHARTWNVLFQEAIDVEATLLAGNVVLSQDGSGAYEALAGRYRVRDVEDPPPDAEPALRLGSFGSPDEIAEPWIRDAVARVVRSALLEHVDHDSIVVELNVQREPVGRRGEQLLFWEWRALPSRSAAARPATAVSPDVVGVGVAGLPAPRGDAQLSRLLGGKGAGLHRAFAAGLPVPPFVVLCAARSPERLPDGWGRLDETLPALAHAAAEFFGGHGERRLAVRSSPSISMPGMLDTVLDVEPTIAEVQAGIRAVLASWTSERAREYRQAHAIGERAGLAVILQPMVAAAGAGRSGSGVGFTRSPVSGAVGPEVEMLEGELGLGLVAGDAIPLETADVRRRWPDEFRELASWCPVLERTAGDMQEFEFAIERGRASLLQTRPAKRTPLASLRVARDLLEHGVVDVDRAAELVAVSDAGELVERRLETTGRTPVATGRVASPGVAIGRVAFDMAGMERILESGDDVVLLSAVPSPDDYPLIRRVAAVVSSRGGVTSHASVVALEAGIVAVVGCRELTVSRAEREGRLGEIAVREGDWLSISAAARAEIYPGRLDEATPTVPADLPPDLISWARTLARPRSQRRRRAPSPTAPRTDR